MVLSWKVWSSFDPQDVTEIYLPLTVFGRKYDVVDDVDKIGTASVEAIDTDAC